MVVPARRAELARACLQEEGAGRLPRAHGQALCCLLLLHRLGVRVPARGSELAGALLHVERALLRARVHGVAAGVQPARVQARGHVRGVVPLALGAVLALALAQVEVARLGVRPLRQPVRLRRTALAVAAVAVGGRAAVAPARARRGFWRHDAPAGLEALRRRILLLPGWELVTLANREPGRDHVALTGGGLPGHRLAPAAGGPGRDDLGDTRT
mmetsp:Transcript_60173/g.154951  ORF Transcript_60173/g.154951 Transcript_60173/m.154951 type:complete len:214 (+) Transcript_60173:732-1373(+)